MKKRVRVAAHMGCFGGNIPGNTMASAELALRSGADIIELDVTMSADGQLFVFHPHLEWRFLNRNIDIQTMMARDVEKLRFVNLQGTETGHTVCYLKDMLAFLKDRCVINIDKFGDHPAEIAGVVRDLRMQDQVIVKSPGRQEHFDMIAETASDLPYIPVLADRDEVSDYLGTCRNIRFAGVEAVWSQDDAPIAQDEYIAKIHGMGKYIWVNSIVFDDNCQLVGGHSDDVSLLDDADRGWGWLARKQFDIIQTDWPLQLSTYLRMLGH